MYHVFDIQIVTQFIYSIYILLKSNKRNDENKIVVKERKSSYPEILTCMVSVLLVHPCSCYLQYQTISSDSNSWCRTTIKWEFYIQRSFLYPQVFEN